MSSLWTPGGERPVPPRRDPGVAGSAARPEESDGPLPEESDGPLPDGGGPDASETARQRMEEDLAALRQQLAEAPVEVVVANHCFGLFELAALHLSLQPPNLEAARLAIDALAAVVEGLGDRLGDQAGTLRDGLAQLRLAYVQIHAGLGDPPAGGSAQGPMPA